MKIKNLIIIILTSLIMTMSLNGDERNSDGSKVHEVIKSATDAAKALEKEAQTHTPDASRREAANKAWKEAVKTEKAVKALKDAHNAGGDFKTISK
ncbi:MAG: hypothetical protein OEZ22_14945 [Spirochaetia bacterium]|nr:hypothetical protein [Spirochaetia bacterium]